ncbi:YhgE/Pip domain-containing protein [Aneurinibacillus migulanus]|uniref:Phage infection protein n=1 Tax=Aneurinibacillus migulanus TaxID=47500 RepID=A0A0D1YAN8_ANEMI|nr:YhgE/Pip domain-containing protein [Aneurinibacillus migulanus]KIV56177.1 phage infection protein [Aneurinibacillus migulanus]KON84240.1 phage infection protein [Aneurinibacillus migulanus]MED0895288.1 YhgE/Pip domain-containing protein [Aneurinibacillus migulanus]MED1616153.1 YhgE/Pip domain-containing protein [Aneurinibacillus migulanus]SDJ88869.1 putative membrane protein [Aneurinibacillus migulanus]
MKKILQIYKTDWKNIFKVPIALFLIVGLMALPSLYAWFNLKAGWDPYGDTSGIAIAVTNEDEGTHIRKGDIDKEINVGKEIVDSLKKNKKLGWTFVSKEEAERGVNHGDYYASLLIPKDFSAKIATILEENPQKPEIEYSVNEKINAIAPKITTTGASGVVAQVSENFVKTASEAIFTIFNEVGIKLEQELPTIRNIENRIFELEKRLPDIEQAGNKALEFEKKLPEIRKQSEKVIELEKKLPEIKKAANHILTLEEKLPKIKEVGDEILVIQQKLPEIQKAADRIVEIDQNFYKVESVLNKAIEDAKKAAGIISSAQQALPKLEQIAKDGGDFANSLNEFLQKNDGAFESVAPIIKQNLILLQQTADAVTQITETLKQANIDPKPTLEALSFLEARLSTGVKVIDRTTDLLTKLNKYIPNHPLDRTITRLHAVKTNFEKQISTMQAIQNAIKRGEQPAKTIVDNLNSLSKDANDALGGILSRYDSEIVPNINKALDQLKRSAQNASDVLQTAQTKLPDIKAILDDAALGINYGQQELIRLQGDLPEIRAKVHEVAQSIQEKMERLTEGINAAANFVQNDLPKLEPKIHQAADFVRNDLPRAEQEVHKVSNLIRTKLPEVEAAVHKVANLVRQDLPELEDSVRKAADKIREFEKSKNLGEIIELLKNDIRKESDFLAQPVLLKENKKFPIPNYGSAMSPFYTTLCLWVGAILLVSLLRLDVEDPEGIYKSNHIYFGRLLTFLTIGVFQALIVTIGDMAVLGAYVVDKVWFVMFGVFISIVFMTIVYTFVSVFGNMGKALAIIMLVLQLSGSGGTFPIQVTPPFFQAIHPFLPFTYAIGLMREAVGGMLYDIVIKDIVFLLLFLGAALLLGLVLKEPLSKSTQRVAEKAKESKIIH